ncbi:MAG: GAF domain-containing protein [Desulfobacter sp.]|nr:GAF domain-containing protein [Desulfobacter sp.]
MKRQGRYDRIYTQLDELITDKSPNLIAAMATIAALLHHKMPHHFWTGFYFSAPKGELNVGPYQGTLACQVLKETGVCLSCVKKKAPVVVKNVEEFPGHIACDARSKSEIVIPLIKNKKVMAVLDIDSLDLCQFSRADIKPLEKILSLLTPFL